MHRQVWFATWGLGLTFALGCSAPAHTPRVDRSDLPLERITPTDLERFHEGAALFEATYREVDGLGPLFIKSSCSECHRSNGRGPGLVGKMAVVDADGFTTAADQSALLFGPTQRPNVTAGAKTPLGSPEAAVRVTFRLPPAVFGRGYLEAVADEEIEQAARVARAREGSIHGRINHTRGPSPRIGRFGLKARIASLDDFTSDSLQNDMGITSPLRSHEPPNPDGLDDDGKPGLDVDASTVDSIADYLRLVEIPARRDRSTVGPFLFERALCASCHVPTMKTRDDYPIRALAGIRAPVYTDLLVHDMGTALADGVVDGQAGSREWRTAPLMGLRFFGAFLHDGRAHTIKEAIDAHDGPGSEAADSIARYRDLSAAERDELVRFVSRL